MNTVKSAEKKPQRLLKVVKQTLRDLDPDRLADAVGGQDLPTSMSIKQNR